MTAKIFPQAKLGKNVTVDDFTVIHDNVVLGDNVRIGSHCLIGAPSAAAQGRALVIGENSTIRSHSIFYEGSTIGPGLQTGHAVLVRELTSAGPGLQLGSQTDVEGDCVIGDYVKVHSDVHIAQKSKIGDFVYLHPRVMFTNDPWPPSFITAGITVKSGAVIATGSLLLPGITIGLGAFVAAASVVRNDVPDVHCVAGNPAAIFARLDRFFHPAYGLFHPWIKRFREKYPPEAEAQIQALITQLDALIATAREEAGAKKT
jgi:acetyltransferase-like isoleucine patch superfamily enzyme